MDRALKERSSSMVAGCRGRGRWWTAGALLLLVILVSSQVAHSAPAGYSHYYVPADEASMAVVFEEAANNRTLGRIPGAGGITKALYSVIGVTTWTDNTRIYIDHWEDGYEFDPEDPGDTADETCPVQGTGDFLSLISQDVPTVLAERGPNFRNDCYTAAAPCATPVTANGCYYDGRDLIYVVGGSATLSRVIIPEQVCNDTNGDGNCVGGVDTNIQPNPVALGDGAAATVQALAWEVYPVRPQLTTYIMPFGEDLNTAGLVDFQRVFALVQATDSANTVQVDFDGDGTWDPVDQNRDGDCNDAVDGTSITLARGDVLLLNRDSDGNGGTGCGAATALNTKTVIQGTDTLQVQYISANADYLYDNRGYAAFPRGLWDDEYYAPVGGGDNNHDTDIYINNPWGASITISWTHGGGNGSFTVPANSTVSFRERVGAYVPQGTAVHLRCDEGKPFWAVSSIDTEDINGTYNWGYTLVPGYLLDNEYFLSWAPGSVPVGGAADYDNSGLYLAPAQDNTIVVVDYDADGPRAPVTYTLNRLQSQFIYDPVDGDLSGASIIATGPFTSAWGEKPFEVTAPTTPVGTPAIDAGYTSLPGRVDWIDLVLRVDKATDPVIVGTGTNQVTTYTIVVSTEEFDVENLRLTDTLATGWAFCTAGTLTCLAPVITFPDGSTMSATPSVSGQNLTWGTAQFGSQVDMLPNQTMTIEYYAYTTAGHAAGSVTTTPVAASGDRTVGNPSVTQTFTATDTVFNLYTTFSIGLTKTPSPTGAVYPGDVITYTVTATNTAAATQDRVSIFDPLPDGTTYVAGSAALVSPATANVRDQFDAVAYTNNNGSAWWLAGWTETDAGGGGNNPGGGQVQIVNFGGSNRLRLTGSNNITRQYDLSAASAATLTLAYTTSGNLDSNAPAGDYCYVEMATGTAGPWTTVLQFINDQTGNVNYAIPANLLGAATTVRIRTMGLNGTDEYFYVDNVDIAFTWAGEPPNFTTATQGFALAAGANLSFTYQVRVDDPLGAALTSVDNTASVTSTQIPVPRTASASNPVVNPSSESSSVGDLVWLDTDGDGAFDVGEPGIPNVQVTLKDRFGTPLMTTVTDSSGRYLFTGVTPDNGYYVAVTGGLPAGLSQTAPSGRSDDRTNSFDLLVAQGNSRDNFTGVAYSNSDGSVGWGGDWIEDDAAAGGAAGGEIRVTGGELRINGDTAAAPLNTISRALSVPALATGATLSFDWRTATVEAADTIVFEVSRDGSTFTTLETFTGLAGTNSGSRTLDIGSYLGTNPTIRFRITGGYAAADDFFYVDNVNVAYTSVRPEYLDADLGYKPAAGTALFGDLVWSDADGDQVRDAGEPGLEGITVQLYLDVNANGAYDSGTDTLQATTVTGPGGSYLFSRTVNGTDDYLVRVDASQVALTGYTATTPTVFAFPDVAAGAVHLSADFGFRNPSNHTIADRVWFDADSGQTQNGGEAGIAGVTVVLRDAGGAIVASTTTDANGDFRFTGVPGGVRYSWEVTDNGGVLADYYGTTSWALAGVYQMAGNLSSNLDYTATTPHFGYNLTRTIGDTVWNDTANFGTQDPGETGIAGVVVVLYRDDGDGNFEPGVGVGRDGAAVATQVTDGSGLYLFPGLPNGTYWVSIDNNQAALVSYTLTTADDAGGVAGHQRRITILNNNVLTADFGYRPSTPYNLSGTVWEDADANGTIGGAEARLGSVTVDLLDTGTGTVIATTTTAANGTYAFNDVPGGRNYTVRITDRNGALADYFATYEKTEGTTAPFNSQESIVTLAANVTDLNFGFKKRQPTRVFLAAFQARSTTAGVEVEWETAGEAGTAGFFLEREVGGGEYTRVGAGMIPALLEAPQGGIYGLLDAEGPREGEVVYRLVELEVPDSLRTYGPLRVRLSPADDEGGTLARGEGGEVGSLGYTRRPRPVRAPRVSTPPVLAALPPTGTATFPLVADGLYRLGADRIAAALGWSEGEAVTAVGAGAIRLTDNGRSVPWVPEAGNRGILFHGRGRTSAYSAQRVYVITGGAGTAMPMRAVLPPFQPVANPEFIARRTTELDLVPAPAVFTETVGDFWFWTYLVAGDPSLGGHDLPAETPDPSPGFGRVQVTVKLQGMYAYPSGNPYHAILRLGDRVLGEGTWTGSGSFSFNGLVDQQLLLPGSTTFRIEAVTAPGTVSMFLVESLRVRYVRSARAVDGALFYQGSGQVTVSAVGFPDPEVRVLEVTDPDAPRLLSPVVVDPFGDGYRVTFRPPDPLGDYLIVSAGGISEAPLPVPDLPSRLRSPANRADWLVITVPSLEAEAARLLAHRQSRGLRGKVVLWQDVQDEFTGGNDTPLALTRFLRYALSRWWQPPRYVLLAGGASFDYQDRMGYGGNLVPTLMVGTPFGLAPSDNALADTDGDLFPEVAVGRIPAVTAGEMAAVVDKIIAAETAPGGEWQARVVLAADNPDAAGDFTGDSEALAGIAGPGYDFTRLYLDILTAPAAREALVAAWAAGTPMVNYSGHGQYGSLADEFFLDVSHVPDLVPAGGIYPVFAAQTCLAGDFGYPFITSLGETLVLEPGAGAVAAWIPTSLAENDRQAVLAQGFFDARYRHGAGRLGDAVLAAMEAFRAAPPADYHSLVFTLLGDPGQELR